MAKNENVENMKVYEWSDFITDDGMEQQETVILPEGNYGFEVVKVEKSFYNGSNSIPSCNMAKVIFKIDGGELGKGMSSDKFFLCEKMEWKAAAFLRSIGDKKHGEPVAWALVPQSVGKKGRCHITCEEYTNSTTGEPAKTNRIDKFFDKEEQQPKKEFKAGAF